MLNDQDSLSEQIKCMYQQHYRDVYHFFLLFTGTKSQAEDLTQEVFIKVLKAFPTFQNRSAIKTWILSIAKYTGIDYHRRKKLIHFSSQLLRILPSKNGLPEQLLEEKEERARLAGALCKLGPKYRMVIILRCVNELSVKETAEILGWSESKVKVSYHRALKRLKDDLLFVMEGDDSHAKHGTAHTANQSVEGRA
ncbi:RNA polymerase sigma factor [Brevibacillus sp. NRS-1366]|uniref:RNA polymerase sigma factor n=1 Tax=Brevibacillus sp. NRS-1366 TaxID=3233899 RepID=UPI003D1BB899